MLLQQPNVLQQQACACIATKIHSAKTCLQTLDEVLLACLDDFIVFARYVMLLAKALGGSKTRYLIDLD